MAPLKVDDLNISNRNKEILIAAYLSSTGTMDWPKFMSLTGYKTLGSAKTCLGDIARPLKKRVEEGADGSSDEPTKTPKRKRGAGLGNSQETPAKKTKAKSGGSTKKKAPVDDDDIVKEEDGSGMITTDANTDEGWVNEFV